MPIASPPFGAIGNLEAAQPFGREYGAVRHGTDEPISGVTYGLKKAPSAIALPLNCSGCAEAIIGAFSGELGRNFFPLATLINQAELAQKAVQVALVGEPDDPEFAALRREVYQVSLPNRVVVAVKPGEALPVGHPAHGKGLVGGRAAAYVCDGPVCSLPLTDSQSLIDNLAALR